MQYSRIIFSRTGTDPKEAMRLLLNFQSCAVDCLSRYNEPPLHGNLEVADYLKRKGADMDAMDNDGNTVLHYASSSNCQSMMKWLLGRPGVREKVNMKNKVSFKIACVF